MLSLLTALCALRLPDAPASVSRYKVKYEYEKHRMDDAAASSSTA